VITLQDGSSFRVFDFFNLFGIGSSFFSSGTVFLKIPASGLTLYHILASPKVVFPNLFAWPPLCLFCVEVGQLPGVFSQ
jgi:hypothetical protein